MKHQLETSSLRGIDRSLDEEEWPLLELKDATVVHQHRRKKAGQLVDLFEVNLHGPFRVKGRLGKLKKDQECLALGTVSKLYKEDFLIPEVYTYSLEIKSDGRIIIWVLGNCGWYALSPAKEYKPIFDRMVEKTKIWMFIEAKYLSSIQKGKKKLRGTTQELFAEFSREYPDWPTPKDAAALFHKYHEWIILKMLVREEDIDNWTRTPLHTEIFTKYPSAVTSIRQILKERSDQAFPSEEDLEMAMTNLEQEADVDGHSIKVKANAITTTTITTTTTASAASSPQTRSPSQPIMISNPISRRKSLRGNSKFQKSTTTPAAQLLSSPERERDQSPTMEDSQVTEDESSETEPEDIKPQRRSAKGKSVLRPRQTSNAILLGSTSPLAGRGTTSNFDEDEDMPDLDLDLDAGLFKPGRSKRYATNLSSDSDSDPTSTPAERLKKRYRSIHAQPRQSASRSETPKLDPTIDWPPLRPGTGRPPIEIGYMPSTSSTRPDGSWSCPVPGCKYRLLDGVTLEGRAKIEKHYEEHARVMQDAVDVIGMETAGGEHHVDNLLAKIEAMASIWAEHRS